MTDQSVLAIATTSPGDVVIVARGLSDDDLDVGIEQAENGGAALLFVARTLRIERGRRTGKIGTGGAGGGAVIPSMTALTGAERNRRSEEMTVAAWADDEPAVVAEAVQEHGWKKLVGKARSYRSMQKKAQGPTHHPAKFSDPLYAVFNRYLPDIGKVLDPFAGIGGVHELATPERVTVGVEIEEEWASQHKDTLIGDATALPFSDNEFDAVCTSPAYGNRMADQFIDGSDRETYRAALGRELSTNNSGGMQWGVKYRALHEKAWAEVVRVVKPGGVIVLNISDHIRAGRRVPVSAWHIATLSSCGAALSDIEAIETKRMGFGKNADVRVAYEFVAVLHTDSTNGRKIVV